MKKKNVLALFMAIIMIFTMSACDKKQGATGTSTVANADLDEIVPSETVTLTVYDQLANYSGEQIGWFAKILLDKFNVKLVIIPDSEGTFETRMESKNLGDIIVWGDNFADYYNAIEKGLLFNMDSEDLLTTYAPYIAANCQPALDASRAKTNGNLYSIPGTIATSKEIVSDSQYEWHIRWDLYEQIGKPEVKTLDDMASVLEQIQAICPTNDNGSKTYAVSMFSDWDGETVNFPADLVKAYYGLENTGFGFYDPKTQKYYDLFDDNAHYIEALRFYNKLFQKGLVDPDSLTQGWDGFCEDAKNGTALWNTISWMAGGMYNTVEHLEAGKAMYPLIPTDASVIIWGQNTQGTDKRIYTIGAKTEYPELCMAIIDWLYTPEGVMTTLYGPKDVCWTYENGKNAFTEFGKLCHQSSATEFTGEYSGSFNDGQNYINCTTWTPESINPESGEAYVSTRWESETLPAEYDIEQKWRDYTGFAKPFDYMINGNYSIVPGVSYQEDAKSDELTVTWNQVKECIQTNSWKAIYAASDAEFDTIIADMKTQAESYGFKDCLDFINKNLQYRIDAENAAK